MWKMSLLKGDQEKHMASNKTYWKNIAQLDPSDEAVKKLEQNEFVSKLPEDFLSDEKTLEESSTSRRDFLKYVGFSTAAATIAACEGPVINRFLMLFSQNKYDLVLQIIMQLLLQTVLILEVYLIKTREGRPIKVESNPDAPILGLLMPEFMPLYFHFMTLYVLQGPQANGEDVSWDNFYLQTGSNVKALAVTNKEIILLMPTLPSPTSQKIITDFVAAYPNVRPVVYDTISSDAALNAFETYYGQRALADYDFSKAKTIVSIDADFLGDWQGGGYEEGYAVSRIPIMIMEKLRCHNTFSLNPICPLLEQMQIIAFHVHLLIKKTF